MPIGTSLGITLPTQGGNTGTWGTDLNTEIGKIVTAVEAQVPVTAIDISADFDFNEFAATDVAHVSYRQGTAPTELNTTYVDSTGNLFFRDGANNAVQLTLSGNLNNASAGGLGDSGGDYGTNGISFDWDGTRYKALDGAGAQDYANVRMQSLELRDGSSNTLTVDVPSLSSDYNLTLPSAVPGSAAFVQSDTSGNLSFSNNLTGTLAITGDITATGEVKHGTQSITLHALSGRGNDSTNTDWTYSNLFDDLTATSASTEYFIPVDIPAGRRITQVDVEFFGASSGTKTASLKSKTIVGTAAATVASGSNTSTSSGIATLSITGINYTITSGDAMLLEFAPAAVSDRIGHITVTFDYP